MLNEQLKFYRKQLNLSQQEIAKMLNVKIPSILLGIFVLLYIIII